jgi:metallo-beta-lactamase family protein
VEPLYTQADAEKAVRQFVAINYDRPMPVADGVTVTFRDAGHILGSAQVVLDVREGKRRFRYLFTGDVGRGHDEILRDPAPVEDVDFLHIESTYGDREHSGRDDAVETTARLVKETLDQSGKVIIPSFSIGRTQAIVYTLHQLTLAGRIPRVPIFVDSPLSVNATEVFRLHPECFNDSTAKFLRKVANPFGMENLTYIRELAHSMKLNDMKEPAIIISASGMVEAGRIRHHIKNHIGNPANLILFIGFCAEHTLGAQIIAGRDLRRAARRARPRGPRGRLLRSCGQARAAPPCRIAHGRHPQNLRRARGGIPMLGLRRDAPSTASPRGSARAGIYAEGDGVSAEGAFS